MDKPSRSQWRGFAVLSVVFTVVVLLLLFWPRFSTAPSASDFSRLAQAVSLYGDTIRLDDSARRQSFRPHSGFAADSLRPSGSIGWGRGPRQNPYDTLLVDINTADTSRLQLLRGIGPVFASRIVKYRSLLGGFVSTSQLLEVYGMTTDRFSSIAHHLTLSKSSVNLLPINSASLDQLRRHPYLDYYQARAIVDYRNSVGPIRNYSDLLKINLIDDSTARKIGDYIQYNL